MYSTILVIRRTRRDIAAHYGEDSKKLKFPTVKGPYKLEYRMDASLCRLFAETMNAILPDNNRIQDPKDCFRLLSLCRYYFLNPKNIRSCTKNGT
ncbi:Uncharacterised protein [Rikenella microfusus]|uniref:Uncharacterized protein n=2 Tax=Rikenella microfusus TaxID=28139 RepID=A0A379NEY3_9BACT|nr:Uncharacterised protein [Rikenella microfusus]